MKTPGPADSKSVPGFDNWPRFVGVIEQNKISDSNENYCITALKTNSEKSFSENASSRPNETNVLWFNGLWVGADWEDTKVTHLRMVVVGHGWVEALLISPHQQQRPYQCHFCGEMGLSSMNWEC